MNQRQQHEAPCPSSPGGSPHSPLAAALCRSCLVFCFKPSPPNNRCDFLGNTSAAALDTESATPNGLFQAYFSCYSQHPPVHPHFHQAPPRRCAPFPAPSPLPFSLANTQATKYLFVAFSAFRQHGVCSLLCRSEFLQAR